MEDDTDGAIEWPALAIDPGRLEPFVKVSSPWRPWRNETQLGMLSPEETTRQFDAWAKWIERLLSEPQGIHASMGISMGVALLRKDLPTPVIFMNAIARLLVAVEEEITMLRSQLSQSRQ